MFENLVLFPGCMVRMGNDVILVFKLPIPSPRNLLGLKVEVFEADFDAFVRGASEVVAATGGARVGPRVSRAREAPYLAHGAGESLTTGVCCR